MICDDGDEVIYARAKLYVFNWLVGVVVYEVFDVELQTFVFLFAFYNSKSP